MPSKPHWKPHWMEIIGGILLLVGLGIGGRVWLAGGGLWPAIRHTFFYFLGCGALILLGEGLRKDDLGLRGRATINRQKNPITFYAFVIFYAFVSLAMLTGGALLLFASLP